MSDRLKIFSISKYDWAGCGYFLSEAINSHTGHHSRAARRNPSILQFPYDVQGLTGQRFGVLWDWADVIHVHDATGWSISRLGKKPTVITYHGTKYRQSSGKYHKHANANRWIATVATPDLTAFGLPLLPDVRPDLIDRVTDKHDEFTVCHAPTKRDVKGTEAVIAACKKAGVRLELIEGVPWAECIERKSRCHVLVDQFELGYGCNAIEAWALGMPVISGSTSEIHHLIADQFGYIPYRYSFPEILADIITELKDDEIRLEYAEIGRNHYLEYHSPEVVAQQALKLYEEAIALHDQRSKLRGSTAIKGNITLVRYLGRSIAYQSWFASGTKYTFSAGDRERYVFDQDVAYFLSQKTARGRPIFEVAK